MILSKIDIDEGMKPWELEGRTLSRYTAWSTKMDAVTAILKEQWEDLIEEARNVSEVNPELMVSTRIKIKKCQLELEHNKTVLDVALRTRFSVLPLGPKWYFRKILIVNAISKISSKIANPISWITG